MEEPVSQYEDDYGIESIKSNSHVMLQIGAPGEAVLGDVAVLMKEAAAHRLSDIDRRAAQSAQYGCFKGDPYFIKELCRFLTENYRRPVDKEDLFIINGSSAGLWEVLTQFFRPGDTVFVEDPTYKALLPHLENSEFEVVGIPRDEEGMMLDALEAKLVNFGSKTVSSRYPFKAAIYTIPICHNPTTSTMSEGRQKRLVEIARIHDLLVITDDVYNLLWYADDETDDPALAKPPIRMFAYDDKSHPNYKGNVVSIGSFSKILSPGLRLGWMEMPPKLQTIFCNSYVVHSGSGKNPFLSGILAAGFELGLAQKHIEKIKIVYSERMRHVHGIITNALSMYNVQCILPNAGFFLWIVLPEAIEAEHVTELSKNEVRVFPGRKCSLSRSYKNCMRICITFYDADILYPAVERLCEFIVQAIKNAAKC